MKVEHKPPLTNEKLQLCCFNDLGALTQSACRDLYLKGTPLVYGRDHGTTKDREHLDLIIGAPQVTVWFGTAFETSPDVKQRMCVQLKQMAEIIAESKGTLIVDLGHNSGFSGEAGHPWNALNAVLTYRQIHVCNLGVVARGIPLRKKVHLMISKHVELPNLSTCECAAQGKAHEHRVSRRAQGSSSPRHHGYCAEGIFICMWPPEMVIS